MNILLTNDDGYNSEGLKFLEDYFLEKGHKVYIVAPDREKSGTSQSMTFKDTIKLVKQKNNLWVIHGTPADCTHLALLGLIPVKPDIIISGINLGFNTGIDIIYSGTVAAARQGALKGYGTIALSSGYFFGKINFDLIKRFLDMNFEKLITEISSDYIININFPECETDKCKGIKITQPAKKPLFKDRLISFDSPQGKYFWIEGTYNKEEYTNGNYNENWDTGAVLNNYISISYIKIMFDIVEKENIFVY